MSVDDLISEWALAAGPSDRLRENENLIRFLGEWLFADYQPYPEKADFWDRLYVWLDQIDVCQTRDEDQRAMFDFIPHLMFAGQRDLTAMYRAAYDGPIRRWLVDQASLQLDDPELDERLAELRRDTWFGSLAGMDISAFCRVNKITAQSLRPEFRFIAEFCDFANLKNQIVAKGYKRIVVVEDMIVPVNSLCRRCLRLPVWEVKIRFRSNLCHCSYHPMDSIASKPRSVRKNINTSPVSQYACFPTLP